MQTRPLPKDLSSLLLDGRTIAQPSRVTENTLQEVYRAIRIKDGTRAWRLLCAAVEEDMLHRCRIAFGGRLPQAYRGRGFSPDTAPANTTNGQLRSPDHTLVIRRMHRILGKLHALVTQMNSNDVRRRNTWRNVFDVSTKLMPSVVTRIFARAQRHVLPSQDELSAIYQRCQTSLVQIQREHTQTRLAVRSPPTLKEAVKFCKATEVKPNLVSVDINGRTTFHPVEVAEAAAESWQRIYCASSITEAQVRKALRGVNWDCKRGSEHGSLDYVPATITGEDLRKGFQAMKATGAPGLDGWRVIELRHWPQPALAALASILAAIETNHCHWVAELLALRVALLPKPGYEVGSPPLKLRPLGIASCVYRCWARIRARDVACFLEGTGILPNAVSGFRMGRSAAQAAQNIQHLAGLAAAQNIELAFLQLDLSKFFDTIPWSLVALMLKQLGFPAYLIVTFEGAWHGFRRYYQCDGYLTHGWASTCGFPQGCPLSPVLSILAVLPLILCLIDNSIDVSSLADDLNLMGDFVDIRKTLPVVSEYLSRLGLCLNSDKSKWCVIQAAGSTLRAEIAKFAAEENWGIVAGDSLRTLGLLVRFSDQADCGETWQDLQGQRELLFQNRMRRALMLPVTAPRQQVVASLVASLTFGVATETHHSPVTQATTRLCISVIVGTTSWRWCEEMVGMLLCKGHQALPNWACMFSQLAEWVRLAATDYAPILAGTFYESLAGEGPMLLLVKSARHILQALRWNWPAPFTWIAQDGTIFELILAPTQEHVVSEWRKSVPLQPSTLVEAFTGRSGAIRDGLAHILHAARADWRTLIVQKVAARRRDFEGLVLFDIEEHRQYLSTLSGTDLFVARQMMCGAVNTATRLARTKADTLCLWCGREVETEQHRYWTCPAHADLREGLLPPPEIVAQLAQVTLCTGIWLQYPFPQYKGPVRQMLLAIASRCASSSEFRQHMPGGSSHDAVSADEEDETLLSAYRRKRTEDWRNDRAKKKHRVNLPHPHRQQADVGLTAGCLRSLAIKSRHCTVSHRTLLTQRAMLTPHGATMSLHESTQCREGASIHAIYGISTCQCPFLFARPQYMCWRFAAMLEDAFVFLFVPCRDPVLARPQCMALRFAATLSLLGLVALLVQPLEVVQIRRAGPSAAIGSMSSQQSCGIDTHYGGHPQAVVRDGDRVQATLAMSAAGRRGMEVMKSVMNTNRLCRNTLAGHGLEAACGDERVGQAPCTYPDVWNLTGHNNTMLPVQVEARATISIGRCPGGHWLDELWQAKCQPLRPILGLKLRGAPGSLPANTISTYSIEGHVRVDDSSVLLGCAARCTVCLAHATQVITNAAVQCGVGFLYFLAVECYFFTSSSLCMLFAFVLHAV